MVDIQMLRNFAAHSAEESNQYYMKMSSCFDVKF